MTNFKVSIVIMAAMHSCVFSCLRISYVSNFVSARSSFRDFQESLLLQFAGNKMSGSHRFRFNLHNVLHDMETDSMKEELRTIIEQGPVPRTDRDFLINGWRWHTKSVLRDISRFISIIDDTVLGMNLKSNKNSKKNDTMKLDKAQKERIQECFNFVMNFNWKALMRVEREIFFPWLQELLPYAAAPLVNDILAQHKLITKLSSDMSAICDSLGHTEDKEDNGELPAIEKLNSIVRILSEAKNCAIAIQTAQESIFVPYIEAYVTKKDQEVFNRRVISRLGLLDAQVHLVSMVEAIQDAPDELKKFKKQIPRVAQLMIPIWKSRLYLPRTKCLLNEGKARKAEFRISNK